MGNMSGVTGRVGWQARCTVWWQAGWGGGPVGMAGRMGGRPGRVAGRMAGGQGWVAGRVIGGGWIFGVKNVLA